MRALVRQEKQKRTLACDVPELADIMRVVGADIRAVLRGAHVKIVCPKPCAWESLPLTFLKDVMHKMVAKLGGCARPGATGNWSRMAALPSMVRNARWQLDSVWFEMEALREEAQTLLGQPGRHY